MKTVNHHLIANSKGGCGKSTTAMLLAWYYQEKGFETTTFDYDLSCGSFSLFKSLNISPVISKEKGYTEENFTSWAQALEASTCDTITDFNVESFEKALGCILSHNLLEQLTKGKKHKIYLHMPFSASADLQPCINGFNRISGILQDKVSYVCWLHKFRGEIDSKVYNSFYENNNAKISMVIDLPRDSDYNSEAMGNMLMQNYTFTDILNSKKPLHQQFVSLATYTNLKKVYFSSIEKNNLAKLLRLAS